MSCDLPATHRATPDVASYDILLVEDEPTFRELLRGFIEQAGYRVMAVENGREALAFLRAHRVRLLITDICMPEADGFELLTKLRRTHPTLPFIAMSGSAVVDLQTYLRIAEYLGAVRALPKPFPLAELAAATQAAIGGPAERGVSRTSCR